VFVPGVSDEPVFDTTVNTITKDTDSMTTIITTRDVLVDTAGVSEEIFINGESTLARTVGGDLSHHISLTTDGVDLLSLSLVSLELDGRIIDASLLASRSGLDLARARISAARDVVIAARKRVLDALLSDNTGSLPVVVSRGRITTIARTSARAAVHILSRKNDILTVLDALTIAHGFNSTESPAGTTIALITDHAHGLAVGPLLTSIEFLGSIGTSSLRISTKRRILRIVPGELNISTKEGLDLLLRKRSSRAVKGSSPEVLDAVDVFDILASSEVGRNAHGDCDNSKDKLHCKNNKIHISYLWRH